MKVGNTSLFGSISISSWLVKYARDGHCDVYNLLRDGNFILDFGRGLYVSNRDVAETARFDVA